MKKIVYGVLTLGILLIGFGFLSAATNKVTIVDRNTKINHFGADKKDSFLTNVINEEKSDLANGKVVIDVTIDNSLDTEIIYVLDNGKSLSTDKNNLIDRIKTIATSLESIKDVKQGINLTTDGSNVFIDLDNANIGVQLESIKSIPASTTKDGEIFNSIKNATSKFSSSDINKVLVIFTGKWDTLTNEEKTEYKNIIDNAVSKKINIIVYGINNETSKTEFDYLFDDAIRYSITNDFSAIDYKNDILLTLPTIKENVAAIISFDKAITDNFDINNITISKSVTNTYSDQNRAITFGAVNIEQNEDLVISYTLQVKNTVDSTLVDKTPIRTNRQIILTGGINAQLPADNKIDDICSPTIMILSETTTNPNTGTYDYVIFGSCMLAVALITLVIMSNKKSFNRI